jgi:hypothetical protein
MADFAAQTLRVLRHALELEQFTAPELATVSGASYETVKKVLRTEKDSTIVQTGEKASSGPGRPAEIWQVSDARAIAVRLEDVRDQVQELGAAASERRTDPEALLASAEDNILFALHSDDETDSRRNAAQALAALEDSQVDWATVPSEEDILPGLPARTRNLSSPVGRGWVLGTLAHYLASDESTGLAGPLWRRAFAALAAVDDPTQDALHKRFLVELVRHVDARANAAPFPHPTGAVPTFADSAASDSDRRLIRDFFSRLATWKAIVRGQDEPEAVEPEDLFFQRFEDLASTVFPLLEAADRQVVLAALAEALDTEAGISVAPRVFLRIGREMDLVTGILTSNVLDSPDWHDIAEWYLSVRDTASLSVSQRITLINALQGALPSRQAEAFLRVLPLYRRPQDLPELTDNPVVPADIRADLERRLMDDYTPEAPRLEEVAQEAEFMVFG